MPFGRVFIDNDTWYIATSLLGTGLSVRRKDRGITRQATRYERLFLFEVLDYMKSRGVPVDSGCPQVEAILESFAEALFVQGRPTWRTLFLTAVPRDWADSVLAAR